MNKCLFNTLAVSILLAISFNSKAGATMPAFYSYTSLTPDTGVINHLSPRQQKEGWQLLFNGKNFNGWHTYLSDTVGDAWKVKDGVIELDASDKNILRHSGDLLTDKSYKNFDLQLDWKISEGGNSGIVFYIKEDPQYARCIKTGLQMQVLDNAHHKDGKVPKERAGGLFDLIAAKPGALNAVGEWNHIEIYANKGKLKFFINGEKVLQTKLWNSKWKQLIRNSPFKDMPDFGTFHSGKIALQNDGSQVWFRNVKIKAL